MSGRPKLYQSKQPSGGKETAARLFYTQEAADFYDALMKQNLMKGSKVAESFHAYHEKHENKPPPPPAAETKKSSSKESQTDDKEFNKARDRPVRKSRLWGIVVGVAKACFRPVWKPLDNFLHSPSNAAAAQLGRESILGIVVGSVTGDLWAVSNLPTSILRAVFRMVIGAVTGEFPKARPLKMADDYYEYSFSERTSCEPRFGFLYDKSEESDTCYMRFRSDYDSDSDRDPDVFDFPIGYMGSKELYDFTHWYDDMIFWYRIHFEILGDPRMMYRYDFIIANTARIKAKFRRRLLGWFTVLRSLVKTPTSYFGVGFGLLVLYCDRNINKDKLRECMEGSKWTEYAKNRCEERNAIAKTFAIHPGHMNPIFKPK